MESAVVLLPAVTVCQITCC